MAKSSCSIGAFVKHNGKEVRSKLYDELLELTGKNRSFVQTSLYEKAKSQNFLNEYSDSLIIDEETGEPTFDSFIKNEEVARVLKESNVDILNYIEKKFNCKDKNGTLIKYSKDSLPSLTKTVSSFNQTEYSKDYVLDIQEDKDKYVILLRPKVDLNAEDKAKQDIIEQLNTQFNTLMSSNYELGISTSWIKKALNMLSDVPINNIGNSMIAALIQTRNNFVDGSGKCSPLMKPYITSYLKTLHSNKNLDVIKKTLKQMIATNENISSVSDIKLYDVLSDIIIAYNNNEAQNNIYFKSIDGLLPSINNNLKRYFLTYMTSDKAQELGNLYMTTNNNDSTEETEEDYEEAAIKEMIKDSELDSKVNNLLNKLLAIETKRKRMVKQRGTKDYISSQENLVNKVAEAQMYGDAELGILTFLKSGVNRLSTLNTALKAERSKAKALRYMKDVMYSYSTMLDEIRDVYEDLPNSQKSQEVKQLINEISAICDNIEYTYKKECERIANEIFEPLMPKGMKLETTVGKKRIAQNLNEIIRYAPKDITTTDRALDSLADSSDYYLKLYHKFVSNQVETIRQRTLDVEDRINAIVTEYEKTEKGNNYDWFFEEKEDGTLDKSRYIQEINYNKYFAARDRFKKDLEKRGIKGDVYNKQMSDWYKANNEVINGQLQPKKELYKSEKFARLNEAQKKFYNDMMLIYENHINMLPPNSQHTYDSIKILNSNWERIRHSNSLKKVKENIIDKFKEDWTRYSDDIEYGEVSSMQDFQGRAIQKIPVYYTKLRNEKDVDRITTDIPSAMLAFVSMAQDFKGRTEIVDICEVLTDQARFREIEQTRAGKSLVEKVKTKTGEVINKISKKGDETNSVQKLVQFNNMQLYLQRQKDEGTIIGNIDQAKAANQLNKLTAMTSYALNGLSSITNLLTGKLSARIEAIAGEHFKYSDLLEADKYYGKHIIQYVANIGKRIPTDMLSALNREYDILQTYEKDVKDKDYLSQTRLKQILGPKLAYIGNDIGEHYMQLRTFLALASAYKVKDSNGNITSILNIMETVPVNKDNPDAGVRIKLKKGYTNMDGSSISKEDLNKLSRKSRALNNSFHGIYNEIDKSTIQASALGRCAIMFRKYLKPALNRRFQQREYSFDMEGYQEGYYRTTKRFLWDLFSELKQGNIAIEMCWNELEDYEKANIKKAGTEVGTLLAIITALQLIDWDDDDDNYLKNLFEVSLRRWYNETQALVPSVGFISSNLKLTTQPAAGVNYLNNVTDMLSTLLHPIDNFSEDAELQSGAYKGFKRGTKSILKTLPYINPMVRTINPETTKPYYK